MRFSSSPSSASEVNIRDSIVARRRIRLRSQGYVQGLPLPERRTVPLVPFSNPPLLICEIKRRSPSRGEIDSGLNPVQRADAYSKGGVNTFSVLTEEEFFGGSLSDLVAVKSAYPNATVLRKDFLLDPEDIDVSYRLGADAILLIASILDRERLEELYHRANHRGLSVLVEVHTEEDVEKVRSIRPGWMGINARNLETFQTDLLHPLHVRGWIDWEAKVVFESGVRTPEDGWFVGSAGFEGLLVGEAVVRDPSTVPKLRAAYEGAFRKDPAPLIRKSRIRANQNRQFWNRIAEALRRNRSSIPSKHEDHGLKTSPVPKEFLRRRPLVKVCGITNPSDAYLAVEAGADLLGFIFAHSPRQAPPSVVRELKGLEVLKVGVVVAREKETRALLVEVSHLVQEGYLDALQVHGMEDAEDFLAQLRVMHIPYYPVWNPKTSKDVRLALEKPLGVRFLVDASKEGMYGGTGIRVPDEVLQVLQEQGVPLWLAGGLRGESIREVVEKWNPELVDVSSGVELYPGKKDPEKLRNFFKEIQDACTIIG
ncbi:MAG: bifunctional indole-3-glycerol phosphate synthase/phosphoribosylanthranilate isomerase [Spirochaetes bacterium]|nr:bifunctional indole-3-glycerol phosphate synthase/phosphoribosylanthranilate isomerase [Spirochaetota bacterium]